MQTKENSQKNQGVLSIIKSETPSYLSKKMVLIDGKLVKKGAGQMVRGIVEKGRFNDITEFSGIVDDCGSDKSLCFGCCVYERAEVVRKQDLHKGSERAVVARTLDDFKYKAAPGVFFIDVDGRNPKTAEEIRAQILFIEPAFKDAPMMLRYSSGSGIYHHDGRLLIGAKGWHVFVFVSDARDIPRAGKALFERAWLAGMGFIDISSAGSFLVRGPVDPSVWQSNRFAFVGPVICGPGLIQKRPAPVLYNTDAPPFEATAIKSLNPTETETLFELQRKAKQDKAPEAKAARVKWEADHVVEALAKEPDADEQRKAVIKRMFHDAVHNSNLFADFEITLNDGAALTVEIILNAPDKYHGLYCYDPLEPETGRSKGRIYSRTGGKPYIWSYLHGGRKFYLIRARKTLQIMQGERYRLAGEICDTARLDGNIFSRGGEIIRLTPDGQIMPLNVDGFTLFLDSLLRFEKYNKTESLWKPFDCSRDYAIAAATYARQNKIIPELLAVVRHPVLNPYNGRLISMEGYDPEIRLLLWLNGHDFPTIPETPTLEQCRAAADALFYPFKNFPFVDPVSGGVFIAMILTGLMWALLPTAPGFAISATCPGTGKTLLARCAALFIGITSPPVMPGNGSDDELKKKLLAVLREGAQALIFDNLNGVIHSDGLCAALTSDTFKDRILGLSETIEVSTRTLMMMTGNNLTIGGDLCRRILKSELDAKDEAPWRRHFGLDPAAYVVDHRSELVMAGLLLIRAGLQNGGKSPDAMGSFTEWDNTIRRTVCWLRDAELMEVDDPAKAIDTAFDQDPETAKLGALVYAWHETFYSGVSVAYAINTARSSTSSPLLDALYEIGGEGRDHINARRIGRFIERNARRRIEGMYFVDDGKVNNVRVWTVKSEI